MSKSTTTASAAATTNAWEQAVADESLAMADRIEAFKALALERKAGAERNFAPKASLFKDEADRLEAAKAAPEIYAALVEQERLRARSGDFEKSPLVLFALGYKSDIGNDGTVHYGPFAYIVRSVIRPRARAIGELAPIDFGRIQGSGGTFAERLLLLKREYERIYGSLNTVAQPRLIKKADQA